MYFPGHKVEQFFRTYVIQNFSISSDESRLLFSTNLNGKMNIWAMELPHGFPYLFAHTEQSAQFMQEDEDKQFVLTALDEDGNENYQLQAVPFEGGLPQPLFDAHSGEKHFFQEMKEDGSIYFATSKDNPSFLSGYRYQPDTNSLTKLYDGKKGATFINAVSPDGSSIVVSELRANTHIAAYAVNKDGEWKNLSRNPDEVHVINDAVFINEEELYFVSDENSEHAYIVHMNLSTGERTLVMSLAEESVSSIKWHKETSTLFFSVTKGVEDLLYAWTPDKDSEPRPLHAPVTVLQQLTISKGGNVYVLGMKADEPFNIHKYDGTRWSSITENRVLGVPKQDMVTPQIVTYETFDEKKIESLWFPAKPEKSNGHVIFWPHGGPQAAERKQFRAMFQSFLNEGYSIFAPNFRGSTGYGASFTKLVEQDWGHGPRLDCVAGIEWLFSTGKCSRDKLFLVGGSYGGYMALLLAGRHGEYFRAVVDIFGVSNLFTFMKSVPEHWKPIMNRWLGDPEKDKERLERDSPITYLRSMTKPMLVIQGANDPRVVKEESDQIVEALRRQGTSVDYVVLEDEGHGFSKKENEIRVYKDMLNFLAQHQSS
ncbi:S9 family peptidase [Alkalicoccus daliensis]|uniref:Dipeptidyl aminopeptidase/acylaminoacyl peptidase n=1 Tax=Alkalicoccus daliensis TaxID=745820 RepID=A0A1G9ZJ59_9BACI|nr:S9 family peptidase [Alkalicoccus daliensis]SDN21359.1 Dipeptidyl aminopeptidase/acylaminoacyl peptidase [Alkalicoccus daliensis]